MAAPYRPTPPPSRGFLNDLFPVSPLEVAGGLYGMGTDAAGRFVGNVAGQPFPAIAPNVGLPNAEQFGHDVTAMLDMPVTHGAVPHSGALADTTLAAAPLALSAKAAKAAKAADDAAAAAKAASPLDAVSAEARTAADTPTVASTIAKRAKPPKDLPNVTWNPDTQAWEGGPVKGVPMEPPPHVTIPDIYDTKDPSLATVPPVPQVELPRYEPPKGPSDRVADLISNEAVRQRMLDSIQQGKDIGMSWHNTQPAIQDAIDALGSDQAGRDAFKRFIDYNAATSSLNAVPTNLREASYYYWREKAGLDDPVEVGSAPPAPYHGGLANQGHQKAVNQILEGTWGLGDVAKTPSYGANLEGNLTPVAMDRHAIRAPGMMSEDPRWLATQVTLPDKTTFRPQDEYNAGNLTMEDALKRPTYWTDMPLKNEYAPLEDYYQELAKDAGMAPGQAQASGWVGNAELTGVDTDPSKTFLDMFQDRIKNTAYRMGKNPREVVQGFWQGKWPLLAVPGAAAVTAPEVMQQMQQGDQGATPPGPQASAAPATPAPQSISASPGFQDWWQQLQNQKFAGGPSTTPT
jgi:hypothetical protein